jgi:hypothetical protein
MAMKISLAVLGLLLTTFAVAPRAQAQSNYLWCARYGTPYDDTSCGFTSFEQWRASAASAASAKETILIGRLLPRCRRAIKRARATRKIRETETAP